MSNNLEMKRNSVKIVLGGKTKPSVGIIMQNANDLDATDKNAFDVIRSIRQVLQKPDVSHIQLLAWLRNKKKKSDTQTKQQGREWSRFMAGYLHSNANANAKEV